MRQDPVSRRLPRLEAWRASGKTFSFQGHDIFFRDTGSDSNPKKGLLLLHGFPTSSFDWHFIWEPLTNRFRVVTADMLGFGFSAKPRTARYSILTQADLFEALARHLGIQEVHLLAHDYGDTVAQELLARNRAEGPPKLRIQSTILLNGGLFPEAHRALLIQKLLASVAGPLVARLMSERGFRRRFAGIFGRNTQPTSEELDEYWAVIRERDGHLLFPKLIGYIAERRANRERWVTALQDARVPIRLIDGLDDPISGGHMVKRYQELIARADVVELAGIGHYPQCEAPMAVAEAILDFHTRTDS